MKPPLERNPHAHWIALGCLLGMWLVVVVGVVAK